MSMPGVVLAFVHGARYGLRSPQLRAEIPFRIEFECGAAERLGGRSRLAREEFAAARLGAQLVVLDEHFAAQQHGRGPALYGLAFPRRIAGAILHGLVGERDALLRIPDRHVRIRADRERALPRIEPVELRRIARGPLDKLRD